MLRLTDFPPAPHLRPYVQRYILTEGFIPLGQKLEHLLIPGLTEIVYFNLSEDAAVFSTDRGVFPLVSGRFSPQLSRSFYGSFAGRIKIIGAHLYTPAGYRIFRLPMHEIVNEGVLVEDLLGRRGADFCDQIREQSDIRKVVAMLDQFLTDRLRRESTEVHPTLLNSLSLLDNSLRTGAVRAMAGYNKVTPRTLQKVFVREVGLTPKEYCRMYRFSKVIQMINEGWFSWKHAVDRLGYYDQAHFLNDFKQVTGLTPSKYLDLHPHVNQFITDFYD